MLLFFLLCHTPQCALASPRPVQCPRPLYNPVIPAKHAGTPPNAGLGWWAFSLYHLPFCHFYATVSTHHKARVPFEVVSSQELQAGSRKPVPSSLRELSSATPSMPTPAHYTGWVRRWGPAPNLSHILLQARKGFCVFL